MRRTYLFILVALICSLSSSTAFAATKIVAEKGKASEKIPPAKAAAPNAATAKRPDAKPVLAAPSGKNAARPAQAGNMTEKEMLEEIAEALDSEDAIIDSVPGLKKEQAEGGKSFYTFEGIKIEALGKDKMAELMNKVRQQKVRIHTENINRQLETVRRIQQIDNLSRAAVPQAVVMPPAAPRMPPVPPSASRPPQVPRVPSAPAVPRR